MCIEVQSDYSLTFLVHQFSIGILQKVLSSTKVLSNQNSEIGTLVTKLAGIASNSEMETSGCLLRNAQVSQTPNFFHSNEVHSSIDMPIQNVQLQEDECVKNQLLARYLPRTADEELRKVAGSYPFTINHSVFVFIIK